jgi:hypothetical protein
MKQFTFSCLTVQSNALTLAFLLATCAEMRSLHYEAGGPQPYKAVYIDVGRPMSVDTANGWSCRGEHGLFSMDPLPGYSQIQPAPTRIAHWRAWGRSPRRCRLPAEGPDYREYYRMFS